MDCARHCPQCGLDSERTQNGRLPPWELAKALAFHTVIAAVCDHLGQAAPELLGKRCDAYIAEQLTLVGGGHPTARAVRAVVVRCRSYSYYPGQPRAGSRRAAVGRVAVWPVTAGWGGRGGRRGDSGRKSNSERAAGGRQSGEWQPGGAVAEGCKLYTFLIDSGRGAKCGIWDSGRKSNYLAYCS